MNQSLNIEGSVSEHYNLESVFLQTRCADCYRALDQARQMPVTVWVNREPFALDSPVVRRFSGRIQSLKSIIPPVASVLSYGIDSAGYTYAVLPFLDGSPIHVHVRESKEAERRFMSALRLISRLHDHGVTCGDISSSSFWVDRAGEIKFVGILGAFGNDGRIPPAPTEFEEFIAPEERAGELPSMAGDVYSLAVLAFHLFGTGPVPLATVREGREDVIRKSLQNAPEWASEAFVRALSLDPGSRQASASLVLEQILKFRESKRTQKEVLPRAADKVTHLTESRPIKPVEATKLEEVVLAVTPRWFVRHWKGASIAGVLIILSLLWGALTPQGEQNITDEAVVISETQANPVAVVDPIIVSKFSELDKEIDQAVRSDDPVSHDLLVQRAVQTADREIRRRIEKGIIDRTRRMGFVRSAEEVQGWLNSLRAPNIPPAYDAILRVIDSNTPVDMRSKLLRRAYIEEPLFVVRLAAALFFDSHADETQQPIIAQLVGDHLKIDDAASYSALALILADPLTSTVYGDDVIQNIQLLPDTDIVWLLGRLAGRREGNVRAIANAAMERNVLSPARQIFARLLRDREDLPPTIVSVLVNAVSGACNTQDIAKLGEWYDLDAEKILLAMMADFEDAALRLEAFDMVAGKSLTIQPSGKLIQYVRNSHWDARGSFTKIIGMLSAPESFTEAEYSAALEPIDSYVQRDPLLLEILCASSNSTVVRALMGRYATKMGASRLLSMLGNPEPSMRILAIEKLKSYNQVQLLRIIIDQYERERNPEVLKAYEETFWFIRERSMKRSPGKL